MWRFLLRCFASFILALVFCTPAVHAQTTAPEAEKTERSPPALQYAVAGLYTVLVLVIVCMPSRKA